MTGLHRALGALDVAGALLGAIVLHTAWDASGGLAVHIVIALVSVGTLLTLVITSHRSFVHGAPAVTA